MSVAKKLAGVLACCLLMAGVVGWSASAVSASAMESEETVSVQVLDENERGLATNLVLSMGGESGEVWAQVKNQFTLFPSTIIVIIELYSSDTYQESYHSMTLEKSARTEDLNMGDTIRISVSTGGKQKYWQARMRYKFDNREWVEKTTETSLRNASGVLI